VPFFSQHGRLINASPICFGSGKATAFHHGLADPNGGCYAPQGITLRAVIVINTKPDRGQINETLQPSFLEIHNDSSRHAHHKAMAGNTSQETHFRVVITSEAFKSKTQPSRHRLVYALLKEEMAQEGGIHALQLRTRTLEEEKRQQESEGAKGQPVADKDAAAA
jgi:stress-induced morphogen